MPEKLKTEGLDRRHKQIVVGRRSELAAEEKWTL